MTDIDVKKQQQHFAELKKKYKASQSEDTSPSGHLYKLLERIDSGKLLSQSDAGFLRKRKLTKTLALALEKGAASLKSKVKSGTPLTPAEKDWLKDNGYENLVGVDPKKHFAELKSKYHIEGDSYKSSFDPLYDILQQLDNGQRLEPDQAAWLAAEYDLFYPKTPIFITYHRLEAAFYEQEYQRTGNKWNLANSSSHWRKAEKPKRALTQTDDLNFDKIKENKLKSALLTTRGGAFRDLLELTEAEQCARRAMEYQPSSHHPYTLMGAICYEQGKHDQGDYWFDEAVKRGASPRDKDAEIKRIMKNADKEKRHALMAHLLKKDHDVDHYCTLMGAICYQRGKYEEGDHWFAEGVKHGSSPRQSEAEIKRILKKAHKQQRRALVTYLLEKDSVQYHWATKYLADKKSAKDDQKYYYI